MNWLKLCPFHLNSGCISNDILAAPFLPLFFSHIHPHNAENCEQNVVYFSKTKHKFHKLKKTLTVTALHTTEYVR